MHDDDLDLGGGEQQKDPFAETPADVGGEEGGVTDVSEGPMEERLGGAGETLDGSPPPEEVLADPEDEEGEPEEEQLGEEQPAEEAPVEEPPAEAEPAEAEGEPAPEGEAETPEAPAEAGEPAGDQEEPKPKRKGKGKGKGAAERAYTILLQDGDKWAEPDLGNGSSQVMASNADAALSKAYDILVPEGVDEIVLAAIAGHYWNPQPVSAEPSKGRSIKVGR